MSARRCSDCGLNFPGSVILCQRCDGKLEHVDAEPDAPEDIARALAPPPSNGERDPVNWRFDTFVAGGLSPREALALAYDKTADLHVFRARLIARGCDPTTAFKILEPL